MGCTLSKTNLDKAIFYNFEDLCELKYDKKNIYIGNLIIPKNDITNFFISKDSSNILPSWFLDSTKGEFTV